MIKKLLALMLLAVPLMAADTTTPKMGLVKPEEGSVNWGPKIRSNFDIIDASAAVLTGDNVFTGQMTLNSPTGLRLTGLPGGYVQLCDPANTNCNIVQYIAGDTYFNQLGRVSVGGTGLTLGNATGFGDLRFNDANLGSLPTPKYISFISTPTLSYTQKYRLPGSTGTINSVLAIDGIDNSNVVQLGWQAPGSGSGGASSLAITTSDGIIHSSPTAILNFDPAEFTVTGVGQQSSINLQPLNIGNSNLSAQSPLALTGSSLSLGNTLKTSSVTVSNLRDSGLVAGAPVLTDSNKQLVSGLIDLNTMVTGSIAAPQTMKLPASSGVPGTVSSMTWVTNGNPSGAISLAPSFASGSAATLNISTHGLNIYDINSTYASINSANGVSVSTLTISSLGSGQCIQTAAGGRLVGTGAACGAGGGSSTYLNVTSGTVTYGLSVGSLTVTGATSGELDLTEGAAPSAAAATGVLYGDSTAHWLAMKNNGGAAYNVAGTSTTNTAGHLAVWGASNNGLVDGGASGIGTPGTPVNSVQFNSAGAFAGNSNFNWSGSSLSVQGSVRTSSLTVLAGASTSTNDGPAFVDIFKGSLPSGSTAVLVNVGTNQQENQFVIGNQQPVDMTRYGASVGELRIGQASNTQKIYSNQATTQFLNVWNSGDMELKTATAANGGKAIILSPRQIPTARFDETGMTILSSASFSKNVTITSGAVIAGNYFPNAAPARMSQDLLNTASSLFINGGSALAGGTDNIMIGVANRSPGSGILSDAGSNTCIGGGTTCSAIRSDSHLTAVGAGAATSSSNTTNMTAIGAGALFYNIAGVSNTGIGNLAHVRNVTGNGNTSIGDGACDNENLASSTTASGQICLGARSYLEGSNMMAIGSEFYPITDVYMNSKSTRGNGNVDGTSVTFHSQNSTGTNKNGGSFTIAAGQGTGTGSGGSVLIQVSSPGVTGLAVNPLMTVATFSSSGLSISSITFSGPSTGTPLSLDSSGMLVSSSPVTKWSFTTAGSYTWTKPSWAKMLRVRVCGGGGGGVGGEGRTAGTQRAGGSGGGGAACNEQTLWAYDVPDSTGVVVASGGTGGTGGSGAAGTGGSAGGVSIFGSLITAYGGATSIAPSATSTIGGSGGGWCSVGSVGGTGTSVGGCPQVSANALGNGGAGAGSAGGGSGKGADWGGATGGGSITVTTGTAAGWSARGSAGGGGAGGCNAADFCSTSGMGGVVGGAITVNSNGATTAGGPAAGTSGATCTNGTPGADGTFTVGAQGGGAGGADTNTTGCIGGAGGICGGGGGGGGAGTSVGGAGGAGGVGCVYIVAW